MSVGLRSRTIPRSPASPGTRDRLLAAAADEFGARGFAATTVDRIARRARVNKAMIYYHFHNKRALYTTIVRNHFSPIVEQLDDIAAQPLPLDQRLDRLIAAIVESVDASTYFLPIFLREIADGGVHLSPDEIGRIAAIFATVTGVIAEGGRQKVFRPIHPALAHFTLIGPLIMYRASAPVRARIKAVRRVEFQEADSATLTEHLQMVARRMLAIEKTED
jgi:TetR/AcrR family transcriptional regulator